MGKYKEFEFFVIGPEPGQGKYEIVSFKYSPYYSATYEKGWFFY